MTPIKMAISEMGITRAVVVKSPSSSRHDLWCLVFERALMLGLLRCF